MQRKTGAGYLIAVALFSALAAGSFLESCQSESVKTATSGKVYYTCPMHPQIHEDKPGDCPVCGMKLVKITPAEGNNTPLDTALSYLMEPVTKTVVGSFKVIRPVEADPTQFIVADGHIGIDERDTRTVSSRVSGRIEKLFVKYSGAAIRKGEPLMTLYSPELLSAQRNLLQALKNNDSSLLTELKRQLLNLGMPGAEVKQLIQSGKPAVKTTIYSPADGILQQVNPGSANEEPELLNFREGKYVSAGQTLFFIQNINRVWALLDVFAAEISDIRPGDPVTLYADVDPARLIHGKVDFIPPYRMENQKTTQIRVYLNRLPQSWKIGTLIHGNIALREQGTAWYLPLSAINRLGKHDVVWVQDKAHKNVFHATPVQTGVQTGDSIEVLSGIRPEDKIAANAGYMVDSDSFTD